jgi:hypothetical protein
MSEQIEVVVDPTMPVEELRSWALDLRMLRRDVEMVAEFERRLAEILVSEDEGSCG